MEQKTKESGRPSTVKAQIKAKWDKLTEGDIREVEQHMEMLSDKVQKAYGRSKEVVDREVAEFQRTCGCESAQPKQL